MKVWEVCLHLEKGVKIDLRDVLKHHGIVLRVEELEMEECYAAWRYLTIIDWTLTKNGTLYIEGV